MKIRNNEDIEILREGGRRLAAVLRQVSAAVAPGVSTDELDILAKRLIEEGGDTAAFLNYTPDGAARPYPATLCVSLNDEVVHGIPNEIPSVLREGDIISLDLGLIHRGLIVDAAVTVPVGKVDAQAKKLLSTTKKALEKGIAAARGGASVGDIGHAIQTFVKPHGYGIPIELGGHGVGLKVHEKPYIPNVGQKGVGEKLTPGMVIAIEPMLNEEGAAVRMDDDDYTIRTADGSRSAHFEHTILITEGAPEILTKE
jgi:methionyl aminopeptidase